MEIERNSLFQFNTNDLENVTEIEAGKKNIRSWKKNKLGLLKTIYTKKYSRTTRGQEQR